MPLAISSCSTARRTVVRAASLRGPYDALVVQNHQRRARPAIDCPRRQTIIAGLQMVSGSAVSVPSARDSVSIRQTAGCAPRDVGGDELVGRAR